ncbi:hypothetical protein N5C81_13330 [Rhizobium pusense]|nr:hypothetical protein [Agrobacterium pusense]MDH1268603.1 hypothetical protein [Agrobacterium pusense]
MVSKTNASTPDLAPHTPKALCGDAAEIVSVAMCLLKTEEREPRSLT